MKTFLIIFAIYLLIGILVVMKLNKYVKLSYKNTGLSPFWNGFIYGLFQWGNALLFPILIHDWYFWNKNEKS